MKLRVRHHTAPITQKLPKMVSRIMALCDTFADGDLESVRYVSRRLGLVSPRSFYLISNCPELDKYSIRNRPGKQNKRLWGNRATIAYAKKMQVKGEDI